MARVLATLAILLVVLVAVGFAVGWITLERSPEKATIDVNTRAIEQAADETIQSSKEAIDEAAKSIEKAVDSEPNEGDARDDLGNEQPQ